MSGLVLESEASAALERLCADESSDGYSFPCIRSLLCSLAERVHQPRRQARAQIQEPTETTRSKSTNLTIFELAKSYIWPNEDHHCDIDYVYRNISYVKEFGLRSWNLKEQRAPRWLANRKENNASQKM